MTPGFGEAFAAAHYWPWSEARCWSYCSRWDCITKCCSISTAACRAGSSPATGTHILAIWLFGLAIFALVQWPQLGYIAGADPVHLLDAVYVSATTYSTLGYGDLVPKGPIRFLLGTEAVSGFVMITWSASFAYLEMARYWKGGD